MRQTTRQSEEGEGISVLNLDAMSCEFLAVGQQLYEGDVAVPRH